MMYSAYSRTSPGQLM